MRGPFFHEYQPATSKSTDNTRVSLNTSWAEMLWNSHWRVWIESDRELGARRVLEGVFATLDVEPISSLLEPYRKGGHVASFRVEHRTVSWSETILAVISLAQRLGRGWRIYGSIEDDPSGWLAVEDSGDCSVSGVSSAEWRLERSGAA
jgi:predicted NAD/FAD-dependent oxidoreductase